MRFLRTAAYGPPANRSVRFTPPGRRPPRSSRPSPVVDVWSEPTSDSATLTADQRETQVLFGEHVIIHESSGAWVRIEAVEQPEFTHHQLWEGYPGWVLHQGLTAPRAA